MGIYDKLLAVQAELKAPKGQYNRFGKYHYRSCEDILEAVKPLCKAHGAAVLVTDTLEQIGNRYYVHSTANFYDVETGEHTSVSSYAREPDSKKGMDDCQVTGTASSYARKYALNGLFCIDDTKDADTDAYAAQTQQEQKNTKGQSATCARSAANPAPPPAIVRCKDCGNVIKDVTRPNGQIMSAAVVANKSTGKYGQPLCWECCQKRKEAVSGNQGG